VLPAGLEPRPSSLIYCSVDNRNEPAESAIDSGGLWLECRGAVRGETQLEPRASRGPIEHLPRAGRRWGRFAVGKQDCAHCLPQLSRTLEILARCAQPYATKLVIQQPPCQCRSAGELLMARQLEGIYERTYVLQGTGGYLFLRGHNQQ
jgi:hypothetical protein